MAGDQIGFSSLMLALTELGEAIENDPENALEAAQDLSIEANIPVGWIQRVELGFEVMGRDGEITTEEAMAVIDTASKFAFLNTEELDPIFMDETPFIQLMENEAAILAMDAELIRMDAILADNERILAANQSILDAGIDSPLQNINDFSPKGMA
ncbi:MAG: hypothetical protein AB8B83_03420 [Bdellovibrionales bacterium]